MSRGQFSFDYREAGQAALEFSIAALTLLLAAWALYEGMLWHRQRQILHLALLDAARAASFSHTPSPDHGPRPGGRPESLAA